MSVPVDANTPKSATSLTPEGLHLLERLSELRERDEEHQVRRVPLWAQQ
jgi:hypothetical protein